MSNDRREISDYVYDITNAIEEALAFVDQMQYEDFINDDKTLFAVIRALEIIGEAAKNIPSPIREKYTSIPWQYILGMRNKLIHEYFGINKEIIWRTIKEDLPRIQGDFYKIQTDIERK
jgi:uncharacterized protein with HEPN domain